MPNTEYLPTADTNVIYEGKVKSPSCQCEHRTTHVVVSLYPRQLSFPSTQTMRLWMIAVYLKSSYHAVSTRSFIGGQVNTAGICLRCRYRTDFFISRAVHSLHLLSGWPIYHGGWRGHLNMPSERPVRNSHCGAAAGVSM